MDNGSVRSPPPNFLLVTVNKGLTIGPKCRNLPARSQCPLRVIHAIAGADQNRPLSVVVQSRPKWCGAANAVMCQ